MTRREQKLKILTCIVIVVFFVSLVPILYSGLSAHPTYDDYWFSGDVHKAIVSGSGFVGAIKAAAETVHNVYFSWQGTFTAIFLFALQPGAFSVNLYGLTTIIMISVLTLGTWFILETIICRIMHSSRLIAILITGLTLIMSIQFVPDIRQAFFWYNGSSYYTLFYGLSLFLIAIGVRLAVLNSEKKCIVWIIIACILAIIIGGGNYTTALLTSEVFILLTLYLVITKNKNLKRILPILAHLFVAFAISMIAPGNFVRASGVEGMSPVRAILMSAFYSCVKIGEWTRLPQIVYISLITPLNISIAKKANYSYNHLPLAIVVSLGLFSSQMTPSLFAMSNIGAGRQINIYYYAYYLLLLFIDFYLCGWICNKIPNAINKVAVGDFVNRYLFRICFISMIVWGIGCFGHHISNMTSIQTVKAIIQGDVQVYDQQADALMLELEQGTGNMKVKDVEIIPPFFTGFHLDGKNESFFNEKMAYYFGVDSIEFY